MKLEKLVPWNWFKKEEEEGASLPVRRLDEPRPGGMIPSVAEFPRQLDRLFDEMLRATGISNLMRRFEGADWFKPAVDVGADDKNYTVSVELPGLEPKDVQVELIGDTLRIRGEKRQESEEKDKDYYRIERCYGSFQRVLTLPEDADGEKIKARHKNGVLTLTIPRRKLAETNVKRIEVKGG